MNDNITKNYGTNIKNIKMNTTEHMMNQSLCAPSVSLYLALMLAKHCYFWLFLIPQIPEYLFQKRLSVVLITDVGV